MLTTGFSLLAFGVQKVITRLPPEEAQQLTQQLMSRLHAEPTPSPLGAAPTTSVETPAQCTILSHELLIANRTRLQLL